MTLANPKPVTFRSKPYRLFVAGHPCEVGNARCQGDVVAAHTKGPKGTSLKAPDTTCIPLYWTHHGEQHQIGAESFAERYSLDYGRVCIRLLEGFIWRLAA